MADHLADPDQYADVDEETWDKLSTATEALGWRMAQLKGASRSRALSKPPLLELIDSLLKAKAHADEMLERCIKEARSLAADEAAREAAAGLAGLRASPRATASTAAGKRAAAAASDGHGSSHGSPSKRGRR